MIDTVIFDLDGTLLYTLENLHLSTNYALDKYGFKQRTLKEIRSFVGNGVELLIKRAVPDDTDEITTAKCLADFKEHYAATMYDKTRPYDGIVEMLDKLNADNIKCAVVSNKFDAAVKELCERYFGKRILYAVGERDGIRKKPAPDSVLEVIRQIGGKNCVYVGDSEVDIQTAQNAGIPCISVSWGYKDKDYLQMQGAELIAGYVASLLNCLYKI